MDPARISCCTYPLIGRPLAEAAAVISAAGFTRIDLLGRMPHFSVDPAEFNPEEAAATLAHFGLSVANLGAYCGKGFASPDEAVQARALAELQRAVDLSVFFGARSMRVVPGDESLACLDRIVPWFRQAAAYAASRNIYLGIENHHGGISARPELCRKLAQKVSSPFFGVLYEPYNLMSDGVDYRAALDVMQDFVVHTHVKDGRATPEGFKLVMLGEGEIDFAWIQRRLEAVGYRGDFALEYEVPDVPVEQGLVAWHAAALRL